MPTWILEVIQQNEADVPSRPQYRTSHNTAPDIGFADALGGTDVGQSRFTINISAEEIDVSAASFPTAYVNPTRKDLIQEIEHIFIAGDGEIFEDGMESEFSRSLTSAIKEHGNDAISAVAALILGGKVAPAVASEALRWIGYIEDAVSHASRLRLLIRSLECSSAWVRDGASLGLSYLGDLSAIPALEKAIKHEKYKLLRRNMGLAIADLQEGND